VVDANAVTGLGTTTVNDWTIHDGLGSYAPVVARGRGLHVYAAGWHNSFTIVFDGSDSSVSTRPPAPPLRSPALPGGRSGWPRAWVEGVGRRRWAQPPRASRSGRRCRGLADACAA
jgi:hypothetical protein